MPSYAGQQRVIWNIDLCLSVSCYPNGCRGAVGPSGKGGSPQSGAGSLVARVEAIVSRIQRSRIGTAEGDREV